MCTEETVYFERTRHIHMWEWISKNPGATKSTYFMENSIPLKLEEVHAYSGCYACLYAHKKTQEQNSYYMSSCDNCPLEGIATHSACGGGMYARWIRYMDMYDVAEEHEGVERWTADRSEQVLRALRNLQMECAKEASRIAMEIAHLPVKPGVLCR